jgi:hypothetical protein
MRIVIKSSIWSCVLFILLTDTVNRHFSPSFFVWYLSIVTIVYSIIFILLFFKQRRIKEPSKWLFLEMVGALILYFIIEIGGILLK